MSSKLPRNPDWMLQEEHPRYIAKKKKPRDLPRLILASGHRKYLFLEEDEKGIRMQ